MTVITIGLDAIPGKIELDSEGIDNMRCNLNGSSTDLLALFLHSDAQCQIGKVLPHGEIL